MYLLCRNCFIAEWRRVNLSDVSNSDIFDQNSAKHVQFNKNEVLQGGSIISCVSASVLQMID